METKINLSSGNKFQYVSTADRNSKQLTRRKLLSNFLLAPFQGLLVFFSVSQRKTGAAEVSPVNVPAGSNIPLLGAKKGDIYAPNKPVGTGRGIFPGRVSWIWNPEATNPDCKNSLIKADDPSSEFDPWFDDKNTSQEVVDQMLTAGLCSITGKNNINEAWDAIFRFHNKNRGKGDVVYKKGEKIYLKLNRTSAAAGVNPGFGRLKDQPISLLCETSPQIVLAMLRQLVHTVGVPQEYIYVGDAMRNIFQDEYLKYHSEFPGVNYLSNTSTESGRIKSVESSGDVIFYSDNSSIMTKAGKDKIYSVLEEAEYLLSMAAMKGHNVAGISLCTKNHFGSQSRPSAGHLHPGLNSKAREGYGHYRVLVDLMGNKYTGGKNLFYLLDALWTGGNWNGLPEKFLIPPFNNHWCSSLLLSFDPVAIESVAFDFLRTEFSQSKYNFPFIAAPGTDDYLQQAADSKYWPKGITYSPDGPGTVMPESLGVHEHWNNPEDKLYSRNLGKNKGIELVKILQDKKG